MYFYLQAVLAYNIVMSITPPQSEQELLDRARALAGLSFAELAEQFNLPLPASNRSAKGWMGQLVEKSLGATASSRAAPDFELINVELKTLPVAANGKPAESTYVCTVPLTELHQQQWHNCWLRQKLQRVLWLPIEGDNRIPIADRHIGNAILWSPDQQQAAQLQQDWEELMELVSLGKLDQISSHMGRYLQIRPKAANAKALTTTLDEEGNPVATLPRGFYLRPAFTRQIITANYAGMDKQYI